MPEKQESILAGGDNSLALLPETLHRSIALVGLMGVGKTSVGKRLADRIGVPFSDADREIERAAGMSIADYFGRFGEQEFRDGERRVLMRLLKAPPHIIATGGGAFIDPAIRGAIKKTAVSIWLTAPLDIVLKRVRRRTTRPLLQGGNPAEILSELYEKRAPIYATADYTFTGGGPLDATVATIVAALVRDGHLTGNASDD